MRFLATRWPQPQLSTWPQRQLTRGGQCVIDVAMATMDGKNGHFIGRIRREKQRMALSEENKIQFTIPMRPQNEAQTLSRTDEVCIYKEYLHRYLESMGVTPTPATLHQVRKKIPLVYSSKPSSASTQATGKIMAKQQAKHKSSMMRKASRIHALAADSRRNRNRGGRQRSAKKVMGAIPSMKLAAAMDTGMTYEDPTPRKFGVTPVFTSHSKYEDTSGETKYKIKLIPNWKAQGWSQDCVQVAPAVRRKSFDWVKKIVQPEDVLSETLRKEESVFAHLRLIRRENVVKPVDVDHVDAKVTQSLTAPTHPDGNNNDNLKNLTDMVSLDELMADDDTPFKKLPRVILFRNFNFAQAYLPFQKLRVDFDKYNGTDLLNPYLNIEADTNEALKNCSDPVGITRELQRPVRCRIDDVMRHQQDVLDAFPMAKFKHMYSAKDLAAAEEVILSPMCAELVALLCHHVYWQMFGHWSAGLLSKDMREEIIVGIQRLSLPLDRKLRTKKSYTLFQLPLFLDSMCSTVTNVLQKLYPRWFKQEPNKQRTYDTIITTIADVISSVQYLKLDIHVAANTRLVQDEDGEEESEKAATKKKLSPAAQRKAALLEKMRAEEHGDDPKRASERMQHKMLNMFVSDAYSQSDLRVNESRVALARKTVAGEKKKKERRLEQAAKQTNTLSGVLGGKIQSNVSVYHSTSKFVQSIFPGGEDFRTSRHRRHRLLPAAEVSRPVPQPLNGHVKGEKSKNKAAGRRQPSKMSEANRLVLYQIAVNRVKRRHKKLGLNSRIMQITTKNFE